MVTWPRRPASSEAGGCSNLSAVRAVTSPACTLFFRTFAPFAGPKSEGGMPSHSLAWHLTGRLYFRYGHGAGSVRDFDKGSFLVGENRAPEINVKKFDPWL